MNSGKEKPNSLPGSLTEQNSVPGYPDNCFGVAILQFALIFPLLMVFVLTLVDFSRVLAVKALLNKGAEDGVALAVKIPNFEIDIRKHLPGDREYIRYQQARNLIADAAMRLPGNTLVTASNDYSSSYFTPYAYTDTLTNSSSVRQFDVAILRPGESVEIGASSGSWLYHSTYPPAAPGVAPPQEPEKLMKSQPIVVEMRATVVTFSPVLRDVIVAGRAMGYREDNIPRGPIKKNIGPAEPAFPPVDQLGPKFTPYPYAMPSATPGPAVCTVQTDIQVALCAYSAACLNMLVADETILATAPFCAGKLPNHLGGA